MIRLSGLLIISFILLLASCTKNIDKQHPPENDPEKPNEKESCDFGIKNFNLSKRAIVANEVSKGKPNNNGNGNGGGTSGGGGTTDGSGTTGGGGSVTSSNVIYLDFDGQFVTDTYWNNFNPFNCVSANISYTDADIVLQRVALDYAPFNVTVTANEAVYNAANPYKRIRVIVTESWEWYGQVGGVSYINSFTWGNNTPCFVFSSLLGYNVKSIAEACSHEAGHSLGLRHQSSYDASGVKINEYNWGQGSGEIGWAPIMGASYSENLSLWHYGPNSVSATTMQDDVARIASVVGFIADEYSNTTSGAAVLSTSKTGIMNSSNDVDFFSLNLSGSRTVSLIPVNVGANNEGGNLDLVLNIYNSQGTLISTINDPLILNAGVGLSPGSYFISASTTGNQFTTRYGMLSKYTIGVN